MIPQPTPIYHITNVHNLPAIVARSELLCTTSLRQCGEAYTSIAYQSLQGRRATRPVLCGPRGTLHDYVPFYFGRKSPMLYTISMGNVPGASQDDII